MKCQPWPSSGPVTFQPGTCYSFGPHAAPWHITTANLGWIIAIWLIAGLVLSAVSGWLASRYEVTRSGRRARVTRRWYAAGAYVVQPGTPGSGPMLRLRVLAWTDEFTAVPWLLVAAMAWVPAGDDDPEPFWAPVTEFTPGAVRRFRPYLRCCGRVPVPVLFAYETMRAAKADA